jgi:hypothetical protein
VSKEQQQPTSPLTQTTALDLLTEQLKKSTLYQPVPPGAAYQQSPILDRYAFRDQVIQNLQVRICSNRDDIWAYSFLTGRQICGSIVSELSHKQVAEALKLL